MTIAIVLLGGAIQLFIAQLNANRRLLLGARVQQDLQLVTGLVSRSLRRRGWSDGGVTPTVEWRLASGAIQMKLDGGKWQSMTDADTMTVTTFDIAPSATLLDLAALCAVPCKAVVGSCPSVTLRRYEVLTRAHAAVDTSIARQLQTTVVQRNDEVAGACT